MTGPEIDTTKIRAEMGEVGPADISARARRMILDLATALDAAGHWKAEALIALSGWESVWRELGEPGPLGAVKWEAARAEIARLTAALDVKWSEVGGSERLEAVLHRHQAGTHFARAEKAEAQIAAMDSTEQNYSDQIYRLTAQVAAVRALCDERDNPNWGKHAGLMMTKWVRALLDGAVPPPAAGCRIEEVDGDPVLVHGADDWDDIDRAAFADVIRAVKAKHESTHRLPAASADVHKPFTDDGITYCGWDKHEGCGEVWPCATERAKALFLAAAMGEPSDAPVNQWCSNPDHAGCVVTGGGKLIHAPAAPAHAFVPSDYTVACGVEAGHTADGRPYLCGMARREHPVPTHAFVDPPLTWARLAGQEPCGHLLDPDDQVSHCRRLAGDPIHGGGAA